VASGILGVALIQALLAGLGFLVAGVPAAGLLTLVCLVLGVVIVLIPVVIYLFSTADTVTAVGFLIWAILVAPVDNILKPLLLGRGVDVPTLIIFVGAIGGFLNAGIIGLFIGAVVLALGSFEPGWRRTRCRTQLLTPASSRTDEISPMSFRGSDFGQKQTRWLVQPGGASGHGLVGVARRSARRCAAGATC